MKNGQLKFDKEKIKERFNLSSHSYEKSAFIQHESAETLVRMLVEQYPDFYPQSILDLGTGTGFIPELLLSLYPNSNFTLNDISMQMLNQAKEKFQTHSKIQLLLGDMESLDFNYSELIISNFALQWVDQLNNMIHKCFSNSEIFAFTCLLHGTFDEWNQILQRYDIPSPLIPYPTLLELKKFITSLNPMNFIFQTQDFFTTFENARSMMKYLQTIGASYSQQKISFNKLRNLINNSNQKFNVTYKVFFGILKKR